jgi:hypothetical protein
LTRADLREANIGSVDLRGAYIAGAKFGETLYNAQTRFPEGFDPAGHELELIPTYDREDE